MSAENGDPLAQSVEHHTFNVGVLGSNPKRITRRQPLWRLLQGWERAASAADVAECLLLLIITDYFMVGRFCMPEKVYVRVFWGIFTPL